MWGFFYARMTEKVRLWGSDPKKSLFQSENCKPDTYSFETGGGNMICSQCSSLRYLYLKISKKVRFFGSVN